MRKSIVIFLAAAFAAFAVSATHLWATVIPPTGLAPGSQYQLIFVTADVRNATSIDITDYNTFVTSEAALSPGLPAGATWDAVASTAAVNANANAPSGALPVYNTAGQEVTAAGVGIYTGVLDNLVQYDQYGGFASAAQETYIWTGSDYLGNGIAGATLGGGGNGEVGQFALDATWLQFGTVPTVQEAALAGTFYALSSAITVPAPEPATIALLGSAIVLIGAHRLLRRRFGS